MISQRESESARAADLPATAPAWGWRALVGRRFYFVMSLLTVAVVLIGFLPRLDERLIHPAKAVHVAVYVHTAIFTAWLVLLLVQTGLVQAGNVALHRRIGLATAAAGIVLPAVGVWVAWAVGHENLPRGGTAAQRFFLIPLSDMAIFAVLFGLAWLWRKRPEHHKRLMLLASMSLTVAAFARFPKVIVPGGHFNIAADIFIGVALLRDLLVERRVHAVYLVGLALLSAIQLLVEVVRATEWWIGIATKLLG